MYNDQLTEATVSIDDLFLDPNNPRFWSEHTRRHIPDTRVMEGRVQSNTERDIGSHGVRELHDSILRNGFLRLDRIVVRPIQSAEGKYVVVEGNRRLAAIRRLRQRIDENLIIEEHIDDEYLEELHDQTSEIEVLIYGGTDNEDISWILQGIRHIGGIRPWEPAQRAKLVAEQIEGQGAGFTETGQKFGLNSHAVGRLYRSHKALEQMRADDEFGSKAQNNLFSLFETAYSNRIVRSWLSWDDAQRKYQNTENLKLFYSWITEDDDHPELRRRIDNPRNIRDLATLLEGEHSALISKVDSHEEELAVAASKVKDLPSTRSWRDKVIASLDIIKSLPIQVIATEPDVYVTLLADGITQLQSYVEMAEAARNSDQ